MTKYVDLLVLCGKRAICAARSLSVLSSCGGNIEHDETGIWWQCARCGEKKGFISSAELRSLSDREISERAKPTW